MVPTTYVTVLWVRIWIWIRFQIQGFDDQKLEKYNLNLFFFDQKLQFTYP